MTFGELHLIEFMIFLLQTQQVVMPPLFHDPAIDDNNDAIGIPDSAEPMGNDERRTALHQISQSLLDQNFGLGVQG
jgi:hypothetical protein